MAVYAAHPQATGRRDDDVRPPRQLSGLLLHVQAAHYDAVLRVGNGTGCVSAKNRKHPVSLQCVFEAHVVLDTFSVMPAPSARNWSAS